MVSCDDDDTPPPLDSLADQVSAVTCGANKPSATTAAAAADKEGDGGEDDEYAHLPVASMRPLGVTATTKAAAAEIKQPKPPASHGALKRGFFGAKKTAAAVPFLRAAKHPSNSGSSTSSSSGAASLLLGSTTTPPAAPQKPLPGAIPDFLLLPPDARAAVRDKLVSALMPTPGTLAAVQADPVLKAGFDDPEVMAAVAEVAADPAAVAKYRGNAKVRAFYAAMGALLGGRLEEVGVGASVTNGGGGGGAAATGGGSGPAAKEGARGAREGAAAKQGLQQLLRQLLGPGEQRGDGYGAAGSSSGGVTIKWRE